MAFAPVFQRPFSASFNRSTAAVTPWYLAGGAPMPLAAYQSISVASLAASYVNLANPGTYDAAVPGVAPTWSAETGWTFNGTTQYLSSGVSFPNHAAYCMIVRYSNCGSDSTSGICGSGSGFGFLLLVPSRSNAVRYVTRNSQLVSVAPALSSGVLAMSAAAGASGKGYRNGVLDTSSIPSHVLSDTMVLTIGRGGEGGFRAGDVQAWAVYSVDLTGPQIAAISAAMQAL